MLAAVNPLDWVRIARLDAVEAHTFAELVAAAPAQMVQRYGLRHVADHSGFGIALRDIPRTMFNRWTGFGCTTSADKASLERIVDWLRRHASANGSVMLSPSAAREEVERLLVAYGLRPGEERLVTYWRPPACVEYPPASGVEIREIGAAQRKDLVAVLDSAERPGFFVDWLSTIPGREGWRVYVAYDGEIPVATGMTFINGTSAYLCAATTVPDHRQRGAQSALLARRIDDAQREGATLVVVQTGREHGNVLGPSDRNVLRAGFQLSHMAVPYAMTVG